MRVVETWPDYVRRVAVGLTQEQIAAKVGGMSGSAVGKWMRGDLAAQPDANKVIAFAKAFNQPPMEALTAAGYFTAGESLPSARTPLSEYDDIELLDELRRRTVKE